MTADTNRKPISVSTKPKRSRTGLWVLGLLLLVGGAGLALYTFNAEPAGTGQEVIVRVAGDQFPVTVAGETITATNALFRLGITPGINRKGSMRRKPRKPQGRLSGWGKLTNDVIVLNTSSGVVCIGYGTTQTVGPVEVTARSMVETANDNKGRTYKDPDGNTIYFRELGIRAVGSTLDNLQNLAVGVLLTLGAGLVVEWLVHRDRPGRSSEAQGGGK